MSQTLKLFSEIEMGAMVFLERSAEPLGIEEQGVLTIPHGKNPQGFEMTLTVSPTSPIVVATKDVSEKDGGYHQNLHMLETNGWIAISTQDPIVVKRHGNKVWTHWHSKNPNRVDCWRLLPNGELDLFQIGIITHDNGETFRLLGEWRWRGKLFEKHGELVARPTESMWGPFLETRRGIFDNEDFIQLIQSSDIPTWDGKAEELDPPLGSAPDGWVIVEWYIPFGGQTGQGIVKLPGKNPAWIHGSDLPVSPDEDGIKRVRRGDLLRVVGFQEKWGNKQGPPKVTEILEVTRAS